MITFLLETNKIYENAKKVSKELLYEIYKTKRSSDELNSPTKKTKTRDKYLKYKIKYINLKKKLNLM